MTVFHSESEFLQFALNHYDNPHLSSIDEFTCDLKRFQYINNLIKRFVENDDLKERLIINHIVILGNCFTINGAISMLYYKTPVKYKNVIDTFLYYMELIDLSKASIDLQLLKYIETNDQ
jgi:hypothetical protein